MNLCEGIMNTRIGNDIDYMIVYGENLMGTAKKLLEPISKFKKISGFRLNRHKSVVFL